MRNVRDGITFVWIFPQILLQGNIILRNSGNTAALTKRILDRLGVYGPAQLKRKDPNDDPLFVLQNIARMSIQFDLADLTALVVTPLIVTFFVWRDGWFSLEGTGLLVEPCELPQMWSRFIFLICLNHTSSYIGLALLRRDMRKTLLGKTTMHGTSSIAANLMANRRIKGRRDSHAEEDNEVAQADAEIAESLGLTEEQKAVIGDELTLTGLNFRVLRTKQLRKWRFYCAVAVLQTFACFPVRRQAPVNGQNLLADDGNTHSEAARQWYGAVSVGGDQSKNANDSKILTDLSRQTATPTVGQTLALLEDTYGTIFTLPRQSTWSYVDGTFAHLIDQAYHEQFSGETYVRRAANESDCRYDGWRVDGGPWVEIGAAAPPPAPPMPKMPGQGG